MYDHQERWPVSTYLLAFQRWDRLYASESDVCRRQILAYKDGPHALIFIVCIRNIPAARGLNVFMRFGHFTS